MLYEVITNLACFYESITGNPSYRPLFRLSHWSIGLTGAATCVVRNNFV